jgi:hypothetical protein
MNGQEILRSLQDDIDKKKGKFLGLMRELHTQQPLEKESNDQVEKARVDWLIAINHLKGSLPFLGAGSIVNSLLVTDRDTKEK